MNKHLRWVLLLAVLLVSCGSPSSGDVAGGSTDGPDTPVSDSPQPGLTEPSGTPDPGDGAQLVEPVEGVQDPHPSNFEKAKVGDDDMTVTLFYWSGIRECYGLDRVDVDYGEKKVTITVYEGWVGGEEACIDIAQSFKTIVKLDEPLAGRKIIDGSE